MTDVASQYREHAALVADGNRPRPTRALLMEFDATGNPRIYTFGPDFSRNRDAISALLGALTILNANASN
jgi:hypothetical protein